MTRFNRFWKLSSNPSSSLPRMGASKRQTRRLRPHSLTLHASLAMTPSRITALTRWAPIRTSPPTHEAARKAYIRTSPPVVDVVRKASHHQSSYRIQSHRSLQPGLERAPRVEKRPRGEKLAPSLRPPPRRARGHRRHAPRIMLPSTVPQHSIWICEERGGSEVRARLPLPTLKRR
jgi:hypothetical protein